ncbi:hypothetical protein ASPZODRAFT_132591 [Penicilliopsis zonata CBS 506.65]|uniref:Transcription factor domain-containing protein n=1 Tax=Penicilliopsis zonata CBS 506.65 TaxID=1073090 RepID=A0A1L9SH87_9EURO|nr:hypothetical protein ASPZODRAFT_132591 [Penicilliopsis zonata CBS 506.65]OJJ46521.1 hypothetical protein ASPZODRAFT_132591 [Penicilliopsis zonata CBS 506.65]
MAFGEKENSLLNSSGTHWMKANSEDYGKTNNILVPLTLSRIHVIYSFATITHSLSTSSSSPLSALCQIFRQIRTTTTQIQIDLDQFPGTAWEGINAAPERMPNTYILAMHGLQRMVEENISFFQEQRGGKSLYTEAIAHLSSCLAYLSRGSDPDVMTGLSWIQNIPDPFLDHIECHEPMALAILAHYCVVLYHLRHHWWIDDLGLSVLREIRSILGRNVYRIDWAMDATGLTISASSRSNG